ncbi:DNA-3-methyladenine glycosylase family protein [Chitinophaga sp. Ak27]|uniref:DNA-3-methyladenine glycosylase family protein n=1 Tax=Chitinophaga sp. Ak27 TaxID=2726116 RepID=UPI00145CAF2A|nr:DNA-3-methyladenine glycosylase 2 [Chitinophaga sp. Ak27]NLU96037.1 DNA-3-methyladenine glycosylase 2 [Chitinophaga sp. Ak27]
MALQKIKVPINDPQNFSFQECLRFLGRSDKECLHYIVEGKVRRMLLSDGEPVVIEIAPGSSAGYLEVTVLAPLNVQVAEAPIIKYITHWWHLDANLQPFYDYTAKDPLLKGLADEYRGLRLIGMPDLFEAISWPVIGQQINLAFAYTLRQRFITQFGYHAVVDHTDYYLYPHPVVVAALEPEQLTPMQFSRSKALYLVETAKQMASGRLSEASLDAMSYEEALQSLVAMKGIGNWSANYALMKYRRFPQSVLLEDVGLQNAIKNRLHLESKPSMPALQEFTRPWKEHAAYATFYLWRSLLPR